MGCHLRTRISSSAFHGAGEASSYPRKSLTATRKTLQTRRPGRVTHRSAKKAKRPTQKLQLMKLTMPTNDHTSQHVIFERVLKQIGRPYTESYKTTYKREITSSQISERDGKNSRRTDASALKTLRAMAEHPCYMNPRREGYLITSNHIDPR